MTRLKPKLLRARTPKQRAVAVYRGRVCPDGIIIEVNWDAFGVGTSVFIPAINLRELKIQVGKIARNKGFKIKYAERIENSKLGLRVWRIL